MTSSLLLLLASLNLVACYNSDYYSNNRWFDNKQYCDDLSPYYGDINLEQIAGVWYGVEKISHNRGEYRIEHSNECFYIDIKELYIEAVATNINFCPYLKPTHDFDEETLLGMWYIHEYIYHKDSAIRTDVNPYCPIVQIRKLEDFMNGGLINGNLPTPPTPYPPAMTYSPYLNTNRNLLFPERHRVRHFVVEWHEGLHQDDYHVKVNTSHKGFWPTDVPDRSVEQQYRFFGGVIQVLKVANNHLVLNFCMRLPHSQFYSVVLSRNENQLTPEDLASIHNVFTLKNLSTSNLKRVCENAAGRVAFSSVMLLLTAFLISRRTD